VLVIIDASSKDMGTTFNLINKVIIPNTPLNRILVAINKCDLALEGGRGWDYENGCPDDELIVRLQEKVNSVKERIKKGTRALTEDKMGVDVQPIYYSAENKYNISKLLANIVEITPTKKRFFYTDRINSDEDVWKNDDRKSNKQNKTVEELAIELKELKALMCSFFERFDNYISRDTSFQTETDFDDIYKSFFDDDSVNDLSYEERFKNSMEESMEEISQEISEKSGVKFKLSFSFVDAMQGASDGAKTGAALGAFIGCVVPVVGVQIGTAFGAVIGGIGGFCKGFFKKKKIEL